MDRKFNIQMIPLKISIDMSQAQPHLVVEGRASFGPRGRKLGSTSNVNAGFYMPRSGVYAEFLNEIERLFGEEILRQFQEEQRRLEQRAARQKKVTAAPQAGDDDDDETPSQEMS